MSSKHILYGDAKSTAREGDSQRKQRGLSAAEQNYTTDPSAANRMILATALFDMGKFSEAEQHMTTLLETNKDNPDMLFELGFIYKNLGRKDEAIAIWKQLVAAAPRHPLAKGAENEIWRLDQTYKPSWLRAE
ncbi:MAG: tetratricopeptide repeat protein [bacterium]|nr:tetratricopeptide repeat protein [bacterium]